MHEHLDHTAWGKHDPKAYDYNRNYWETEFNKTVLHSVEKKFHLRKALKIKIFAV